MLLGRVRCVIRLLRLRATRVSYRVRGRTEPRSDVSSDTMEADPSPECQYVSSSSLFLVVRRSRQGSPAGRMLEAFVYACVEGVGMGWFTLGKPGIFPGHEQGSLFGK